MAECSYARCLQERRLIKRELMKWSKDMLHIVGLERVAEELMRPMKWKHCEAFGQKHMNTEQLLTLSTVTSQTEAQQQEKQKETEETFITEKLENISLQQTQVGEKEDLEEKTAAKEETNQKDNLPTGENLILNKLKLALGVTQNNHDKEDAHNQAVNTSHHNSDITNNNNNHKSEKSTDRQGNTHTCTCNLPPAALKALLFTKLPPPPAVDWELNEKCHFCDNGKLLTVNSKGELIAEKNSTLLTEQIKIVSDSDSNDSSAITNNFHSYRRKHRSDDHSQVNNLKKLLTSRLKDLPANMTSMDSMAARIAAIQSISGQIYPNINFLHLAQLQQQQQQQQDQQEQDQEQDTLQQATSQTTLEKTNSVTPTTSNEVPAAAVSPSAKDSPSPNEVTGEQPLDLSSKPSPNSSISGDQKLARSKSSRVTPASLNRAYSDDDVNNALQDIISRKLSSRKSAAVHNVPHSVLRHKINKMTLEAKRNSNTTLTTELLQLQQEMERDLFSDEEHENSDDEANRSDATATPLSATPTDLILKRQTDTPMSSNAASLAATPLSNNAATTPLTTNPNWLEETMLLRTLLLTMGARLHPNIDENMTLRDFISLLVAATTQQQQQQQQQVTSPLIDATSSLLNNGKSTSATTVAQTLTNNSGTNNTSNNNNNNNNSSGNNNMLDQRLLLQILQQQQQPSPSSSSVTMTSQQTPPFLTRIAKSETPDTNSSMDANDAYDEAAAILKIPSFKPVAGSSTTPSPNNNNNNSNSAILPRNGESPVGVSSVPPPPLLRRASQSPPTFSALRDVIVSKFQRTLNEPLNKDGNSNTGNDYKKPCISVVKNIGGTDTARFGAAPNLLSDHAHNATHHLPHAHSHAPHHNHHFHHQQQLSRQEAAALAAGKGTRPKRGKYRNYDRDSLIEAVKAVQRGEMSVHRAGSYYGVPHSTLEYKVKERHLMRPRKREPKPQPGLESKSSLLMNSVDKNKTVVGHKLSQALKNNNNNNNGNSNNNSNGNASGSNSAGSFPNGLKLAPHNMFDAAALASQMQYPPAASLFWPTTPTAAAVAAAQFGPLAHIDFTSRMQRYQEDMLRGASAGTGMSSPNSHSSHLEANHHTDQSIYANLDGIIRQTLDRKSDPRELTTDSGGGSSSGGGSGLLDQLLIKKSTLPYTNKESLSGGNKRLGSPLTFHQSDIKRERTSPHLQSSSGDEDDISLHSSGEAENHSNKNNSNNESTHGLLMTVPLQNSHSTELPSGIMHYNNNNNNNNSSSSVVSANGDNDLQNCEKDAASTNTSTAEATSPVCDNRLQEKLAQIKAEHQDDEQL